MLSFCPVYKQEQEKLHCTGDCYMGTCPIKLWGVDGLSAAGVRHEGIKLPEFIGQSCLAVYFQLKLSVVLVLRQVPYQRIQALFKRMSHLQAQHSSVPCFELVLTSRLQGVLVSLALNAKLVYCVD